jgi:hypothetical protein
MSGYRYPGPAGKPAAGMLAHPTREVFIWSEKCQAGNAG